MTGDPMDGRRQCTATSKQSGERCKRAPIPGGSVCVMHGGKTPAVQAAAEQRLAEAEADKALTKWWVGLENAAPVTDPVHSLQRLAGTLESITDTVGGKINDLKTLEAGDDLSKVRGHVALLDKLLGHLRGVLVDMNRLGIAQQRLQLERDQARMVGVAVNEGLDAIEASVEQREVFTRVMLARLRVDESGRGAS